MSDTLGELLIDQRGLGETGSRVASMDMQCRRILSECKMYASNIKYLPNFISGAISALAYEQTDCVSCLLPYTVFSFLLIRFLHMFHPMLPLSRVSPPKAPQPQLPVATAERCLLLVLLRKNPQ